MTVAQVIEEVVALCSRHQATQVLLFGSRAKGTEWERSDIDIAVLGVSDFAKLLEEIEEIPTLFHIDLVDLDHCVNACLLEDIKTYGKQIFTKV